MSRPLDIASPETITPEEAVVYLVGEMTRLTRAVEGLQVEVSRLTTKVQRPDLVKYTVREACERVGLSRSTVTDLISRGDLDSFKERGRRYVTEEAVQSWERKNRS